MHGAEQREKMRRGTDDPTAQEGPKGETAEYFPATNQQNADEGKPQHECRCSYPHVSVGSMHHTHIIDGNPRHTHKGEHILHLFGQRTLKIFVVGIRNISIAERHTERHIHHYNGHRPHPAMQQLPTGHLLAQTPGQSIGKEWGNDTPRQTVLLTPGSNQHT